MILPAITVAVIVVAAPLPGCVAAGEEPAARALHKRAAEITKMKNDFVKKVLSEKGIPYEVNEKGVVVRVRMGGLWEAVEKIEIIPVARDDGQGSGVTFHEIYITTKNNIYGIVSDMAVKKE